MNTTQKHYHLNQLAFNILIKYFLTPVYIRCHSLRFYSHCFCLKFSIFFVACLPSIYASVKAVIEKNLLSLQGLDNLSITLVKSLSFLLHFILHMWNLLLSSVTCLPSFRLFRIKPNYHIVQHLTSIKRKKNRQKPGMVFRQPPGTKEQLYFSMTALKYDAVILYDRHNRPAAAQAMVQQELSKHQQRQMCVYTGSLFFCTIRSGVHERRSVLRFKRPIYSSEHIRANSQTQQCEVYCF